ncbi:MAG TPA: cupin domain-containing protein [Polyangiaceae bacterium]|nr:cupin domain-containing protein [Polyangiaceae bacterium]
MNPERIIAELGLVPHPEGGYYAETWRHQPSDGGRGAGTAIYFLLTAGQRSHWHRVDAAETWHFYAGAPLELLTAPQAEGPTLRRVLGADLASGERPQWIVEPGHWQAARSLGEFTLVGCTVSPAFEFAHFELAPPDWAPADGARSDGAPR